MNHSWVGSPAARQLCSARCLLLPMSTIWNRCHPCSLLAVQRQEERQEKRRKEGASAAATATARAGAAGSGSGTGRGRLDLAWVRRCLRLSKPFTRQRMDGWRSAWAAGGGATSRRHGAAGGATQRGGAADGPSKGPQAGPRVADNARVPAAAHAAAGAVPGVHSSGDGRAGRPPPPVLVATPQASSLRLGSGPHFRCMSSIV